MRKIIIVETMMSDFVDVFESIRKIFINSVETGIKIVAIH